MATTRVFSGRAARGLGRTRRVALLVAFFAMALLMWGLLFANAASPAWASTITVNNLADDRDGTDGECTLREAITAANTDTASGAAAGECAAGSGSDIIDIGVTGTVNLTNVLPGLSNLDIKGPGADQFTVRRDTGGPYRIFSVASGSVVSISGITITNGNVRPSDFGGGIRNAGTLTITGSTISSNSARFGGGIYNFSGNLTVSGSTLSGNSATTGGGGVYSITGLSGPKTTITNSTISGNSTTGSGGGILNDFGLSVIEHSTITKNTAPGGEGSGVASSGDTDTRTEVLSTIISANKNIEGTDGTDVDFTNETTNSFSSKGYNLIGDGNATAAFNQSGDQRGVSDPKLGDLANNVGPTNTHALLARSPAIDKGNTDLATDQRGAPRPFDDPSIAPAQGGDDSDIGSFEAQSVLNTAPQANDDNYATNEDTTLTVEAPDGVLSNDTDPDTGDTLEAVLVSGPSHADSFTLNTDGSFDYKPSANPFGEDSFTYKARDASNAESDPVTVSLTINPVNDAPSFASGGDVSVAEDSGAYSAAWATAISAGPANEGTQKLTFDITGNTNTDLFSAGPQVASDGTLTFTPAANASGSAAVLKDDGGTANDGVDTSAPVTFTITVTQVNDPPTIAVAAGGSCGSVSGTMNLRVGDVETAAGSLTLGKSSSNTTLVPNANIAFGGSGANRTVTITPAAKESGNATITLTVRDGQGGTARTTITLIVGTDNRETINGTSGSDMIFDRNGDDTINAGNANDLVCGGNGGGIISGGAGDDTLDGGNGNDTLKGESGNDILRGRQGNDRLEGGNNNDTLSGGLGADFFSGGAGTDTATDFSSEQGDTKDNTIP